MAEGYPHLRADGSEACLGRWSVWCLRADPWPLQLGALAVMAGYCWEYRLPSVAMVGLSYVYGFGLGSFLFVLLAGGRGVQLLAKRISEARHRLPAGKLQSRRWFWPWLVAAAAGTYWMVQAQMPMYAGFWLSERALDGVADAALADPANAARLAGSRAGVYRVDGVELLGSTVVVYVGTDKGKYGFARVLGAGDAGTDGETRVAPGQRDVRSFPTPERESDWQGRRIAGDWFVLYSYYKLVKIGWS